MTDEELVKMARLAQRDDRMATGALYGDLADRIEELEAKLAKAVEANEKLTSERDEHWKSFVHWRKEADALTEQLEAARADAKEAEAYAEELEKENTRLSGLMSERGQMLRRYDQMVVDGAKREEAWKDKLAKAVSWLETIRDRAKGDYMANTYYLDALAALATIEGEKT